MILMTNIAAVSHHETAAKAARQAHRWLRRRVAVAGEWATVLHPRTGVARARCCTPRRWARGACAVTPSRTLLSSGRPTPSASTSSCVLSALAEHRGHVGHASAALRSAGLIASPSDDAARKWLDRYLAEIDGARAYLRTRCTLGARGSRGRSGNRVDSPIGP